MRGKLRRRSSPIPVVVADIIEADLGGQHTKLKEEILTAIISLRRRKDIENQQKIFFNYLNNHNKALAKELNSRWIISIMDTVADYGNPTQRANACLISLFFNGIKVVDSYLYAVGDPIPDRSKVSQTSGRPLWDGVMMYQLHKGDMLTNLFSRIRESIKNTPELEVLFIELVRRSNQEQNFLSKLNNLHARSVKF